MKKNYNILNDCRGMDEEEVLETILEQRCITDPDHFFNPTEDDLLPLDSMYRIEEAAQRVIKAFHDNELIGILSDTETEYIPLGRFKVSHYCIEPHKHICGTGTGLTKLGTKVHPGSLSVDPRIIPLGSTVMINGVEYIAEDTGGAIKGNKVDMAVATHKEALQKGVYYAEIYLKVK